MRQAAVTGALGALLVTAACTGVAGEAGGGPGPARAPLRREDRVLVTRFADVTGVAASRRMVFVGTPTGLAVYDRQFGVWLPPLVRSDDAPVDRSTVMAADPAADAVWVGEVGVVTYYQPAIDLITRASVPGLVDYIMFDRRNTAEGAYVRSAGQWSRVSSTGFVMPLAGRGDLPSPADQLRPETLRDLYAEFPGLQGFGRLLTRDDGLRSAPVSAGARSPDRASEVWLGTYGNGLFKVDPYFNTSEHLPYGLLDRGAGALALALDGVWVAGLGTARDGRGGLTFAGDELQQWRWLQGPPGVPLGGMRAYDLDVRDQFAWIATSRGVVRMDTSNDQDVVLWSAVDGLPDARALAIVARADGAWAGTARGLVLVDATAGQRSAGPGGAGPVMLRDIPVRALLTTGDTLWVGSDAGLFLLRPGNDTMPVRPSSATMEGRLSMPVTALAHSDTVVAVANADEVLRLDLRSGQLLGRMEAVDFRAVGGVTAMAMDERTLWVGGRLGVLVVDRGSGTSRFLGALDAIGGETYDIALGREYAWIATRNGVVRLRRLPGGTPR